MKLHPGQEAEYRRRHDALWPELADLLKATGIRNYSIFLDPVSLDLFGVLDIDAVEALDALPGRTLMRKWWAHMKDIMDTNSDHSPVSQPLQEVFFLP